MDLVADMLFQELCAGHSQAMQPTLVRPSMVRRLSASGLRGGRTAHNADRVLNRFLDYPRYLHSRAGEFDVYHVVDHSYAQLVHELPAERTVVTCHDLDTFRCLLEPNRDPRPWFFRAMTRRSLNGLRRAARVVCDSEAVREEVLSHRLIPPERVLVVPVGVHPSCSPDPEGAGDAEATRLLGAEESGSITLLHVGSTIPRKRIDVLLRVFAAVREKSRDIRLVRVGGMFTAAQNQMVRELQLQDSVVQLPFLDRQVLAAVYRRAALVMQTSAAEGFGLPVAEALASGTPVVASDLPVLREVGGSPVRYCGVGNLDEWTDAVLHLLEERRTDPEQWSERRAAGIAQAKTFSWRQYTEKMVAVYDELCQAPAGCAFA